MSCRRRSLYIGLTHYPVYDKHRRRICSAVTTVDLHDLARLCATYGLQGLFVLTPLEDQKALVERVKHHWTEGYGAGYNPHRRQALEHLRLASTLEEAAADIRATEGASPLCIATDASEHGGNCLDYPQARSILASPGRPVLLVLGTAWGLTEEVFAASDHLLEPIYGPTAYNHLSVRTAAAIILDRLAGPLRDGSSSTLDHP